MSNNGVQRDLAAALMRQGAGGLHGRLLQSATDAAVERLAAIHHKRFVMTSKVSASQIVNRIATSLLIDRGSSRLLAACPPMATEAICFEHFRPHNSHGVTLPAQFLGMQTIGVMIADNEVTSLLVLQMNSTHVSSSRESQYHSRNQ